MDSTNLDYPKDIFLRFNIFSISDDEKVTLGNEKIDQLGIFIYLGSIISKDGWC